MQADADDGVSALPDLLADDVIVETGVARKHHSVVKTLLQLLFRLRLFGDGLIFLVRYTHSVLLLRGPG